MIRSAAADLLRKHEDSRRPFRRGKTLPQRLLGGEGFALRVRVRRRHHGIGEKRARALLADGEGEDRAVA